jgi:hypothetical protein
MGCNRDLWRLFCKRGTHSHFQTCESIPCDGVAVKDYLQNTARPDTWEKETHPFRKKHQTIYISDGARIEAEWNFGKGIERRLYSLGVYNEGLLVGCKEGREMVEFLNDLLPIDENDAKK